MVASVHSPNPIAIPNKRAAHLGLVAMQTLAAACWLIMLYLLSGWDGPWTAAAPMLKTALFAVAACIVIVGPTSHLVAIATSIALLWFPDETQYLKHSSCVSSWTLVCLLWSIRALGFRIRLPYTRNVLIEPRLSPVRLNLRHLVLGTTVSGCLFAFASADIGQPFASSPDEFWFQVKWPIFTFTLLVSATLISLSPIGVLGRGALAVAASGTIGGAMVAASAGDGTTRLTVLAEMLNGVGWTITVASGLRLCGTGIDQKRTVLSNLVWIGERHDSND